MPNYQNPYFPATYQPYQQTYQPTYQSPINNSSSSITWVQGEAGAKAYPVAAGTSMLLMDSESECFYIKSSDVSGMPMPLRTFKYREVVATEKVEEKPDLKKYVTWDELEERLKELKPTRRERVISE